VAAVALLGGCATKVGIVVLLPEKNGQDTAVVVRQEDRQVVLDRPYAGADLTTRGPRAYQSNAQDVQARFGAALAAQPQRSAQFGLYFVEGTDELTDASKRAVDAVFAEIAARPVPDIVVIGHTDGVGSDPYNDELSLRRAETVRLALIRRGIAPENITAAGRGKREPAVPTPDGVAEPRNRRVEIFVR
jgi:outer membrane protein OmpA-like peptidoglycan-associated protein